MKPLATFFCLLLFSFGALAADVDGLTASVDRNRLSLGETFELTLETPDANVYGRPDLGPLEPLFEVLSTRQVNRLSTVQGHTSMLTRWIITLSPRTEGFVVIPPLSLGDKTSQSISLQVTAADVASAGQKSPIYIETSVDQDSLYVQAQAVLTLRIFHSVSLYDDSSLSPPQANDARIEQLGDARSYEQLVNGVRHGVIEVRYSITPLKSGELHLPAQFFTATPALRSSGVNPFGSRPGSPVRVQSAAITLNIKPIPESYPANTPWLPARELSIDESLSPTNDKVLVGDSLTRTLVISASGLSSAQLPDLPEISLDGWRSYPDQPRLSNSINEFGLLGIREETQALVPTRSGEFELAGLEVHWWNTQTDTLEVVRIAPRKLSVDNNPDLPEEQAEHPQQPAALGQTPLWPWQLAVVLLALSNLLALILWWRARRQPAVLRNSQNGPSSRTLLDELRRACLANDTSASRQAIDAWARQQPETLAEMSARYQPLSDALHGLNEALYSESSQNWEGNALWQAARSLPELGLTQQPQSEQSPLPPLYPR